MAVIDMRMTNEQEVLLRQNNALDKVKPAQMIKILRKGGNVLTKAIRAASPVSGTNRKFRGNTIKSGNLRRSVGITVAKNREFPMLFVGPRTGRRYKDDGWYAPFIVLGTKARPLKRQSRSKGRTQYTGKTKGFIAKNDFVEKATMQAEEQVRNIIVNKITEIINTI